LYLARQFAASAVTALFADRRRMFRLRFPQQRTHEPKVCPAPAKTLPISRSCPRRSRRGRARLLRVVSFTAEKAARGELSLIRARWRRRGQIRAKRHGGPPYFLVSPRVASPAAGTWHVTLARDSLRRSGCSANHAEIAVRDAAVALPPSATAGTASGRCAIPWNRATENLFRHGSKKAVRRGHSTQRKTVVAVRA